MPIKTGTKVDEIFVKLGKIWSKYEKMGLFNDFKKKTLENGAEECIL